MTSVKNENDHETTGELKNYYSTVQKKFKDEEIHYPNESKLKIKLPFQMVIVGGTGSGKTNAALNIFGEINAFDKVMLFAKNLEETLYADWIDKLRKVEKDTGASILTVSTKIEDLPSVDTINKKNNTLFICDDMVSEKSKLLARVAEYWTRGRKKNVSCMFLSQSYFEIPMIIRQNSSYFIFTKIATDGDLHRILRDHKLGVTEDEIDRLYHEATKGGFPNFFLIDHKDTGDNSTRFRRNFKPMTPNMIKGPDDTDDKNTTSVAGTSLKRIGRKRKLGKPNEWKGDDSNLKPTKGNYTATIDHLSQPSYTNHRSSTQKGVLVPVKEDDYFMDTDDDDDKMGDGIGKRKKRKKAKSKKPKVKRIKNGRKSTETEKMIEHLLGIRKTPYWQ